MTVLVVGHGSIGARHARLATAAGEAVLVATARPGECPHRSVPTLDAALSMSFDHAIVANSTGAHMATLRSLRAAGFNGPILVEKPLAISPAELIDPLPYRDRVRVAYNLRFHPALARLRDRLDGRRAINAVVHAGQDLRAWRPGRDIAASYSARAGEGGVLRDLSHELDSLGWLFGGVTRVAALGGRLGPLPIAADDAWGIVMALDRCAVATLALDYYCTTARRGIVVNTGDDTLDADLVAGRYADRSGCETFDIDRDTTYRAQLDAFLGRGGDSDLCGFDHGAAVVTTIDRIERAAAYS